FPCYRYLHHLPPFPTRRSSDLASIAAITSPVSNSGWRVQSMRFSAFRSARERAAESLAFNPGSSLRRFLTRWNRRDPESRNTARSEEHTSELQSRFDLVCRLLL